MASGLPPPPVNDKPGSFAWLEWYRQLRNYVSTSGSVPWYIINFSGSNITDIATRLHDSLQGLQGGTAGEHYHLTANQYTNLGNHNALTSLQGGTANEYYHLTSQQYSAIANSMELTTTTSGIVLPTTPTVFKPANTVVANGMTYNSSTGEIVFTNGGTFTFIMTVNATASASNKTMYFYGEIDTGSGYAIRRYSARSHLLTNTLRDQVLFSSTNYWPPGSKLKLYLWAESGSTITLDSLDVPGTTAGTVTIPAARVLFGGAL